MFLFCHFGPLQPEPHAGLDLNESSVESLSRSACPGGCPPWGTGVVCGPGALQLHSLPPPHSDKSPGGECFVKLPGDSPATPTLGRESKREKSHVPGAGLHLQLPYLQQEAIPVTVKVSNAFLTEDLKIPRDVKKTKTHTQAC